MLAMDVLIAVWPPDPIEEGNSGDFLWSTARWVSTEGLACGYGHSPEAALLDLWMGPEDNQASASAQPLRLLGGSVYRLGRSVAGDWRAETGGLEAVAGTPHAALGALCREHRKLLTTQVAKAFRAWGEEAGPLSSPDGLFGNRHFREVVSLGASAVPVILAWALQHQRWTPLRAVKEIVGWGPACPVRELLPRWTAWGKERGLLTETEPT